MSATSSTPLDPDVDRSIDVFARNEATTNCTRVSEQGSVDSSRRNTVITHELPDTNEVMVKKFENAVSNRIEDQLVDIELETSLEKRADNVPGVEDVQSSLPLPQPSQESNSKPQVKKIDRQSFPLQKHATSGGPGERVVRRGSKQESFKNVSALSCEDDIDVENYHDEYNYQDECRHLRQQLERAEKNLGEKLEYNKIQLDELYKQKLMMEIENRSRETDMEQKIQSLTATNEQLDVKLKLSNDEREKEKETLTNKLEQRNNEKVTLRARCNEFMNEVDKEILKRLELAELLRSVTADLISAKRNWNVFSIIVTTFFILSFISFVLDYYG
ncbi:uncharacterized protein LOC135347945 [Halichondria panicea]|uniref:uncharacterized protein LOC135347945 n=1 Tax=Halichondria panicea TaxID=6063 RepID=UPI00312B6B99